MWSLEAVRAMRTRSSVRLRPYRTDTFVSNRRRFQSHTRQTVRIVGGGGFDSLRGEEHVDVWGFHRNGVGWRRTMATEVCVSEDMTTTMSNPMTTTSENYRNVAIVAHVDHGKTTLVDQLLRVTSVSDKKTTEGNEEDRVMDSGDLEKERGITITSKVTRLVFSSSSSLAGGGETKVINVVDTPGHADFAGEVDRILGMVDGVCLVVDAAEGCMVQTKYVLGRALSLRKQPLVVMNKLDRPGAMARLGQTESELLDLFDDLGASDEQMDYVTVYASAREGWATTCEETAERLATANQTKDKDMDTDMNVLLRAVMDHIPPPRVYSSSSLEEEDEKLAINDPFKFSMAVTTLGYDTYLGKLCTGRVHSGSVAVGDVVTVLTDQNESTTTTVTGLFVNRGVSRSALDKSERVQAGDIVTVAGVPPTTQIGDTLASSVGKQHIEKIDTPPLAPPTLSMEFGANTSPLMGRDGTQVTNSQLATRLTHEADHNATLRISSSLPVNDNNNNNTTEDGESNVVVYARGELQIGILVEQMRREGYEMTLSPPRIVLRKDEETGVSLEPYEEVTIDVDDEFSGVVVNALNVRGASLTDHVTSASSSSGGGGGEKTNKTRLVFEIPTRGLLGVHSELATLSKGSAVYHHTFLEDRPVVSKRGNNNQESLRKKGKLVSNAEGQASLYALSSLSDRGTLFVEPGDRVYVGMVVGENSFQTNDLDVNPVRAKAVSNVRSVNKDEKLQLKDPPLKRNVEDLIGYMDDDEVLEVTPLRVTLRKRELDPGVRARQARATKKPKPPKQQK